MALRANKKISFLRVLRVLRGSSFFSSSFLNRPFAGARSRAPRSQSKPQRMSFWPSGPKKTCRSSRPSRPSRFNLFFNRPFASLTQARKERKENRKGFFSWPFGPTKKCRSSRPSRPSRFKLYFLTARSLSLTQDRKGRQENRKGFFSWPFGPTKKYLFFAFFASFAVRALFF